MTKFFDTFLLAILLAMIVAFFVLFVYGTVKSLEWRDFFIFAAISGLFIQKRRIDILERQVKQLSEHE